VVAHFVAHPEHVERLLGTFGDTVEELAATMDERVFVDAEGRLCVLERERPVFYEREEASGKELDRLFDFYGNKKPRVTRAFSVAGL
jgi:hypothetical protein